MAVQVAHEAPPRVDQSACSLVQEKEHSWGSAVPWLAVTVRTPRGVTASEVGFTPFIRVVPICMTSV